MRLENQNDSIKLPQLYVYHITSQLKARNDTLNQLCTATQEDDELILLKHMITNGWLETIVPDNGPCYSAETFTKLMTDYSVNHIASSPYYLQLNSLAEKYVQIVNNLFYKAKEEGTDLYKSLMICRNTPLLHKLQSPMQILQSQTARTQLPMPSVARIQQGLGSEQLRVSNKNEHLPTHDFHIGQSVMYLNLVNKRWYPATITSLCQEPQSCKIKTDHGTIYRKTQNHLKLYP